MSPLVYLPNLIPCHTDSVASHIIARARRIQFWRASRHTGSIATNGQNDQGNGQRSFRSAPQPLRYPRLHPRPQTRNPYHVMRIRRCMTPPRRRYTCTEGTQHSMGRCSWTHASQTRAPATGTDTTSLPSLLRPSQAWMLQETHQTRRWTSRRRISRISGRCAS